MPRYALMGVRDLIYTMQYGKPDAQSSALQALEGLGRALSEDEREIALKELTSIVANGAPDARKSAAALIAAWGRAWSTE